MESQNQNLSQARIIILFHRIFHDSNFILYFLRLSKLLRHRGPDWNGIACFRNCILTHERLAIVGLNSGAQPIIDQDGDTAMSVNGEIYNHAELESELKR